MLPSKREESLKTQLRLGTVFNVIGVLAITFILTVAVCCYTFKYTLDYLLFRYAATESPERFVIVMEMSRYSMWVALNTCGCLAFFLLPVGVGLGVEWQRHYSMAKRIDQGEVEVVEKELMGEV